MTLRLTALLFVAAAVASAENWSGYLVDYSCMKSEQNNVSKGDGPAQRDMSLELQACNPTAKTKNFGVLTGSDSELLKLDPSGNVKAADLVRKSRAKSGSRLAVTVNGARNKNTIAVSGIAPGGH